MKWSRNRAASIVVLGAASAVVLAACSSGPATESPSPTDTGASEEPTDTPAEPVTLSIGVWGDFGLDTEGDSIIQDYMAANPHVTVTIDNVEYNAQHEALQQALIAGTGANDIQAIDGGYLSGFVTQADKFVNLLDKGADVYKDAYLPWKWEQAQTADGSAVIGLGTDIGPLATCYRPDLLEAAGLPSDRDSVSAAIGGSWDEFIAYGEDYLAKTGKRFVSSPNIMFQSVIGQQPVAFYDANNELQMDGGPKVAFDTTMKAIEAGIVANAANPWAPEFLQGVADGEFAVTFCPAWMLGHIRGTTQNEAGELIATWDLADIPGPGGNWGGSFLTIPASGENVDEAYKLLEFLITPENQMRIFTNVGNLSSQVAFLNSPEVAAFVAEDFNNAPTGAIFAKSALELTPQYLGPKNEVARQEVESVLSAVVAGSIPAAGAWDQAVENVNNNVEAQS